MYTITGTLLALAAVVAMISSWVIALLLFVAVMALIAAMHFYFEWEDKRQAAMKQKITTLVATFNSSEKRKWNRYWNAVHDGHHEYKDDAHDECPECTYSKYHNLKWWTKQKE